MTVRDPGTARDRFARVKVPGILPRFIPLGDGNTFVPLEQVIATHLDKLFPGMDVVEAHPFRVTRDADIELAEDEADDLLIAVEQELRRQRFGVVVRLEVAATMPDHVVRLLQRELEVEDDALVTVEGPLNLGDLMGLVSALDRPELADEPWVGTTQPRLLGTEEDSVNLFATLREGDLLVHHPYDAFSTSVQRFIEQAADDPDVLAIKQTLYRTDGDSPIVTALIQAAESASRWWSWSRSRPAATRPPTSAGPGRWSGPAATSPTAWSGSRPTPRPPWWCGASTAASAATSTSAPATTTPRRPGSTPTSGCSPATRTWAPT